MQKLTFLDQEATLAQSLKNKCLKDFKKSNNKEVLWEHKSQCKFLIYNLKKREEEKDIEKWKTSMKWPRSEKIKIDLNSDKKLKNNMDKMVKAWEC